MFAKDDNGTLHVLTGQKIIGPRGEQASRQILELWNAGDLKAWGVYEVAVDAIPEGHVPVSEELVKDGDTVRLVRVTEAAPVVPSLHPVDVVGDEVLKVILSLQNEIRELKALPPFKDVEEFKMELKKTNPSGPQLS